MKCKISDFCKTGSGGTPNRDEKDAYYGGNISWFKSGELNESLLYSSEEKITEKALRESSTQLIPKGAVLIAMYGATVGKTAILGVDATTNQAVCHLIPDPKECNNKFLHFFLRSRLNCLLSMRVGGAQPNINQNIIKNLEIDLPALDAQIRIATVLTRAEKLIAKRKESIKALDELLKSTFLEMFGDPVRNEKGWNTYKGIDYSELLTVGVVVKPASYYTVEGVVALRSLNVKPNLIDCTNLVYFSKESSNGVLSKSVLRQGDVVVVRTGLTGTAAVVPKELDGANCIDLIIVRPRDNILNPYYLSFLLNSDGGKRLVSSKEVGGIQKHFNIGAIKDILIPLPPVSLQNKFATIVNNVEALKIKYTQSFIELQKLYGSLSQRAFKGELDLSKVPVI